MALIRRADYRRLRSILVLALAFSSSALYAADIYRYVDGNGRTVYNSAVPPEFISNGYTVLDERGRVIRVVPRALNSAEIAEKEANQRRQEVAEIAAREQIEADNLLLRLFRSPDEITRKRDERLRQLDSQIVAININLNKTKLEINDLNLRMENVRAQNREPGEVLLEDLARKTLEAEQFIAQISKIETDKAASIAQADSDIRRLRALLGLPEEPAAE